MIEVEKKFILSPENETRLVTGSEFLGEKIQTDVYYDTENFSLSLKEWWLRTRNGSFELKVPISQNIDRVAEQFDELEEEGQIRKALNLPGENLAEDLKTHGYAPFAKIITTRRKYRRGHFNIDLDQVDYGTSTYTIAEIERMVNDPSEIEAAVTEIMNFAKEIDLTIVRIRGKVMEYLKRHRPEHYQALVNA